MRDYQTLEKLEEKVFVIDSGNSEEIINHEIEEFLDDAKKRKRNDPFEGGLQASMVIYHDKAAFKISEMDGRAVHAHTEETLAQFLDGDTKYSSYDSMLRPAIKIGDPHNALTLDYHGFTCRILAGSDTLSMAFVTKNDEVTKFQLDVIESCVRKAIEMFKNNDFERVAIGYVSREDNFLMFDKVFDLSREDCYKELDDLELLLQIRIEEIKRK